MFDQPPFGPFARLYGGTGVRNVVERVTHQVVMHEPEHDGFTWIDADDDAVLVNTLPFTQKCRNAVRDSRITVLVIDRADPEHYAEVRGHVVGTVNGQRALDHAERFSRRYSGAPYRGPGERVVLRIQPFRQVIRTDPWRRLTAARSIHELRDCPTSIK